MKNQKKKTLLFQQILSTNSSVISLILQGGVFQCINSHLVQIIKVGVEDCILGGDSQSGIILQHLPHQVNTLVIQSREDLAELLCSPLRELVPVPELSHTRPLVLTGGAQELEDVQQLLELTVTRENGLLQTVIKKTA